MVTVLVVAHPAATNTTAAHTIASTDLNIRLE
jgi:hypothetical protein